MRDVQNLEKAERPKFQVVAQSENFSWFSFCWFENLIYAQNGRSFRGLVGLCVRVIKRYVRLFQLLVIIRISNIYT